MKKYLISIRSRLPYISKLIQDRDRLLVERDCLLDELGRYKQKIRNIEKNDSRDVPLSLFPDGHYYSPIPSMEDIESQHNRIKKQIKSISDVDLNKKLQLEMLREFGKYYKDLPFRYKKKNRLRYCYHNPNFGQGDAISLYSMIRYAKPKRIIEIGSGYSSCVTLDTNQLFFDNKVACSFIEPHPDLLLSLINKQDKKGNNIISSKLQEVPLSLFEKLRRNDILFIDSTHVSKVGSDVNYVLFSVLPLIKRGVYIHFHDIFFPFEYPKEWSMRGIFWNENYILRAFLYNNTNYEIVFFNNYLWEMHRNRLLKTMPLYSKNSGGSIWIRKIRKD